MGANARKTDKNRTAAAPKIFFIVIIRRSLFLHLESSGLFTAAPDHARLTSICAEPAKKSRDDPTKKVKKGTSLSLQHQSVYNESG